MSVVAFRLFTLNIDLPGFSLIAPLLLGGLFVIHLVQNESPCRMLALKSPLILNNFKMLLLFLASVIVAYMSGIGLSESIATLLRCFLIFLLCYFGYVHGFCNVGNLLQKWLIAILIALNLAAITSLVGIGKVEIVDDIPRPVGLVGFSEVMSHLSLFSVLFSLYIILQERKSYCIEWRYLTYLLLFLSVLSLFLSSTLKNVLMLPPAILLLLWLSGFPVRRILRLSFAFFIVCLPAFIYLGAATIERIESTFIAGIDLELNEGDAVQSSLGFRIVHWKLLLTDWYNNYFYFGSGAGNVLNMKGFGYYRGLRLDAHSDIVKFICELGLVGMSFFTYLLVKLLVYLKRILPHSHMAGFCICCIITFSIIASSGKVFYSAFNLYLLSILIGYSFGQVKKKEKMLCVE